MRLDHLNLTVDFVLVPFDDALLESGKYSATFTKIAHGLVQFVVFFHYSAEVEVDVHRMEAFQVGQLRFYLVEVGGSLLPL